MERYVRTVSTLSKAGGIAAAALLIAAILVVTQMVFVRYVLKGSTIWQTEFVTYALMASTFLGSPYVLLVKGHVNVDLLMGEVGSRRRCLLDIAAHTVSLAFCLLLAWSAMAYLREAILGGWTTETVWALPLWIPLLPLPVGIGLLSAQYLADIWMLKEGLK